MNKKVPLIIFLLLTTIYILLGYGVTVSNDSVTNTEQISNLDLWNRTSHFSFHLFGIISYLFFSKLIGLNAATSIEIMLALFSAAASASLFQIVVKKYNDKAIALLTTIIYVISSGIFRFSCQAEYLILVPSLGIISLYLYSRGQFILAGIFFSSGLLTSFLTILFIPTFLLFTSVKELFRKQNLIFAASMITVYLAVSIFTYEETMSGHWSYGEQFNLYKEIIGEINFLRPLSIYIYGYLRSFNIIILLLPIVIYYLYKSNKELFYILIVTLAIHLPVALPEARYGGYQMTAYPLIALSSAYLLNRLYNKYKTAILLLIGLYSVINVYIVFSERTFFRELEETYIELNNRLEKNSILIVYQAVKPITTVYAPNLQVKSLLSDYQNKMAEHYPGYESTDLNSIFTNNEVVYLLESGVSMPDDRLKLLFSRFTKNQGAKVKGFAIDKIKTINPELEFQLLEEYPLDVFKITRRNVE